MLGRQLIKPLDEERFEDLVKFLWKHFPKEIRLSSGEKIAKKEILLAKDKSGLICKIENQTRFIFKQRPKGIAAVHEILSEIHPEDYAALIRSLPQDDCKTFLQCLNLVPDFNILLENEKADIQQNPTVPLQEKKRLGDSKEFDVPLLNQNKGTVYLQHHLHVESWEFMCKRMPTIFTQQKIKVLYIEFPHIILKPLFEHFNRNGDIAMLREHLALFPMIMPETLPHYIKLFEAALKAGIELVPIDTSAARYNPQTDTVETMMEKNRYRDEYMRTQILKHQKTHGEKKFIAFLGALHDDVANALNIPSIIIVPDTKVQSLNPKNTSSKELRQLMWEMRKSADLMLELHSSYQQAKKSSCCTPGLKRLGFFTAAGAVAVTAITYATVSLM